MKTTKMKNITLLVGLLFATIVATAANIGDNKVQLGKKGSSSNKEIVFDTGDGTSNKKLVLVHATKQLSITSNTVSIGDAAASNKVLVFDRGGSNAQIRWNESSSAFEFTKDGSTFKSFGSGSGSGGAGFNVLSNAGFEDGASINWTNSGGTYAEVTSGSNLLFETKSVTFDASSSGQYFQSDLYTVPVGLYGGNCEASINYKGGDTNLKLVALDGSSTVLATRTFEVAATDRVFFPVTFPCPTSGTFRLRVESLGNAAIAAFDKMHLGEPSIFQVGSYVGAWASETFTGSATTNSTYTGNCRIVGDSKECRVRIAYSGTPNSFSTLTINLPFTIDTAKLQSSVAANTKFGTGQHFDPAGGTTSYQANVFYNTTTTLIIRDLQATGSIAYQNHDIAYTSPFSIASGAYTEFHFMVPVVGLSVPQQVYNASTINSFAAVDVSGTPSFSTTSATYVDVSHSSFATKTYKGAASAPGTANDMALRVTNIPAGTYYISANANFTNLTAGFQCGMRLYDGTNTILESSTPLTGSSIAYDQYGGLSGTYTFATAQADVTMKMQLKAPAGGTCLVGSNVGTINIVMIPLSQNLPVPVLVNSVVSDYVGVTKTCSAYITNSGSCAISRQTGCFASVSHPGTGGCELTFNSGAFSPSIAPICTATITSGGATGVAYVIDATTSAVTVYTTNSSLVDADHAFNISCEGPK